MFKLQPFLVFTNFGFPIFTNCSVSQSMRMQHFPICTNAGLSQSLKLAVFLSLYQLQPFQNLHNLQAYPRLQIVASPHFSSYSTLALGLTPRIISRLTTRSGISGSAFDWLTSYSHGHSQTVQIGQSTSVPTS